ncbi:L,D-transpeptidase family protein [Geminisphaera colitermitum]|uniref:L,D-transpeptidase family protein n=1 Tax=Geminisphaera colitermitum TaxID=1148786 RepID=UPI0009DCBBE0|nr:L,D-transpeptidase family protein [Geminisphaera colitermitum]
MISPATVARAASDAPPPPPPRIQFTLPTPLTPLPSEPASYSPLPPDLPPADPTPSTDGEAVAVAVAYPRPARNWLEAQIALARRDLSSGPIDGRPGPQTRAALSAFQRDQGLPVTGALDDATRARLILDTPPLTSRLITAADLASLQPLSPTWLGKSAQTTLAYQTPLELVAEQTRAHPDWLRQVNPRIDWRRVAPGTRVLVPDPERIFPALAPGGASTPATPVPKRRKAARVRIHLASRTLQATDADGRLLAHFPVSIARRVDKRPVGELHVTVVVPNPDYTFDPAVFPESAEARELGRKLILPPGPNNPVGLVWIGLDRPGYGLHGTPDPQHVGRTESHGCFRLANWDALILLDLVNVGTPVDVVE